MTNLTFVRHAQSECNLLLTDPNSVSADERRRLQRMCDLPHGGNPRLTRVGEHQARSLGLWVKQHFVADARTKVVSSDLQRAIDTANLAFGKNIENVRFEVNPDLRESLPNDNSTNEIIEDFVDTLLHEAMNGPYKNIFVFGHFYTNQKMIQKLSQRLDKHIVIDAKMANTSAICFEIHSQIHDIRILKMHGTVETNLLATPSSPSCVIC